MCVLTVFTDRHSSSAISTIDMLVAIHAVDVGAVGLREFGRAGHYFERQLHRWTQQCLGLSTGYGNGRDRHRSYVCFAEAADGVERMPRTGSSKTSRASRWRMSSTDPPVHLRLPRADGSTSPFLEAPR